MRKDNWTWKDFRLGLPGFLIARIYTGENLAELGLKLEEGEGQRTELVLSYDLDSFNNFLEELKEINLKVEKRRDFKGKALKYDFSSESKVELSLYFTKKEWSRFYDFLIDCRKQIEIQAREYKNLTKKEGNK